MASRWKTLAIPCKNGLILDNDPYSQGTNLPGSAIQLQNFEPALSGGYRRINGYTKFDSSEVPHVCTYGSGVYDAGVCAYGGSTLVSGAILGVAVFGSGVVIGRNEHLYTSNGAGWTRINGTDIRSAAAKWRHTKYNWAAPSIILVDGGGFPVKWDGSTYTILSGSGAPTAPGFVEEFSSHIFYGSGTVVQFGAPNQDTVFDTASGGGRIQFGDTVTGLKKFRDTLYIFGRKRISKITGTNLSSFAMVTVTNDIGCLASDSIQEINGDIVFLAPDGFRTIAATERIGDINIAGISRDITSIVSPISYSYNSNLISSVLVRSKSQYRLFATTTDTAATDGYGITGGLRHKQSEEYSNPTSYEWGELRGIQVTASDSAYIGTQEYVIHGGMDGFIYRQEQGNSFNGSAITAIYKTPYLTFGDPAIRKTVYKLDTYYRVEGATDVTAQINLDYNDPLIVQPTNFHIASDATLTLYGTAVYGTNLYGTTNSPRVKNNITGSGMTIGFQFSTVDTNPPYTIQSLVVQYSQEGRS